MNSIPTLETDRLLLRPCDLSLSDCIAELANDPRILNVTQLPSPYEKVEIDHWIEQCEPLYEKRYEASWGVVEKRSGELMGIISLTDIFQNHQAELGFWLGIDYWGNGFAVEMGRAVIDFAFGEPLNLIRIHAFHMTQNVAAGKALKTMGMSFEGRCPKHFMKNGIPEDIDLWGVLKPQ